MSRSIKLVLASLLVVGGLAGGAATIGVGSVRGWIADRYGLVSSTNGGRSQVFASTRSPVATANQIADRWRPADRVSHPAGTFLRYADTIVAVVPAAGGSRIHVDDDNEGYRRWHPYVGGFWGTGIGRGEGFRGGGPGGGGK